MRSVPFPLWPAMVEQTLTWPLVFHSINFSTTRIFRFVSRLCALAVARQHWEYLSR